MFLMFLYCIAAAPFSPYSALSMHTRWKYDEEASTEPPIHVEYSRSSGAVILTSVPGNPSSIIDFNRSGNPENSVLPPAKKILSYRSFRSLTLQFPIDPCTKLWMPSLTGLSRLNIVGSNIASEHRMLNIFR